MLLHILYSILISKELKTFSCIIYMFRLLLFGFINLLQRKRVGSKGYGFIGS